jgi:catechol-2,3-dioxygenase
MFKNTKAFSGFSVDDLRKAKAFYSQTLGLEVAEMPEGLELRISNGTGIFVYPKPNILRRPLRYSIFLWTISNKLSMSSPNVVYVLSITTKAL